MYPFGLRFNSSNADPMVAWSHGIQVAAINMQGNDRPVWVARALFSANGNCGYVKKPDLFLPGSKFDYEQISSLSPKILLKVSK
jgi:phosphatidylinositol phospholipase C delta